MLLRTCLTEPKKCIDCKKKKPASNFYIKNQYRVHKNGERVVSQLLCSVCKPCAIKRTQGWQIKNKDKYRKYIKDYAKRQHTKNNYEIII